MKIKSKRVGIIFALVAGIAALLLEPVNGPKRRARMQRVLEPAGRPLQAARQMLWPKDRASQEPEPPGHGKLIERLQTVAVRAQGKIDAAVEPPIAPAVPVANDAAEPEVAAALQENAAPADAPKPRRRRKKPEVEG